MFTSSHFAAHVTEATGKGPKQPCRERVGCGLPPTPLSWRSDTSQENPTLLLVWPRCGVSCGRVNSVLPGRRQTYLSELSKASGCPEEDRSSEVLAREGEQSKGKM